MKHGPIALIDEDMPVVAIAPNDHAFEKMLGNVQEAKARGGLVIALTTKGDDRLDAVLDPVKDSRIPLPPIARRRGARADGGAAAVARVPHRRAARLRRRPAAEPGEERDGGVGAAYRLDFAR